MNGCFSERAPGDFLRQAIAVALVRRDLEKEFRAGHLVMDICENVCYTGLWNLECSGTQPGLSGKVCEKHPETGPENTGRGLSRRRPDRVQIARKIPEDRKDRIWFYHATYHTLSTSWRTQRSRVLPVRQMHGRLPGRRTHGHHAQPTGAPGADRSIRACPALRSDLDVRVVSDLYDALSQVGQLRRRDGCSASMRDRAGRGRPGAMRPPVISQSVSGEVFRRNGRVNEVEMTVLFQKTPPS